MAIIGASGSGKSTLMNILGCLDVPTYGDYILNGADVTDRTDRQLAHIRNKEIGSGSGKSTLMNILGCLDVPTYGDYILNGADVTDRTDRQLAHIRNKEIGFIFQGYNLIPALTAYENVELPVELPLIYQGISVFQRKERVMAALERVGMADRFGHRPSEMSGGQQQRVAIARVPAEGAGHGRPGAGGHGRPLRTPAL